VRYILCSLILVYASGTAAQNVRVTGDKSQYGPEFLEGLGRMMPDNTVILNGPEISIEGDAESTVRLPAYFSKETPTRIEGCAGNTCTVLDIKALNYTDISVNVKRTVNGKTYIDKALKCSLSAGLILALEVDETENGDAYGAYVYTYSSGNDYLTLRIGECSEGQLCVRMQREGAGVAAKNTGIGNSPLLKGSVH